VVGEGAELGPDTRLVDCTIGRGAVVERTVGRHADVGDNAVVGPYAVLEPGAHIRSGGRTGSFYTATTEESEA
jgi:bifunctional UDP-N-acetylglucosamine pyrophosphorylase/glucosamine-1-phosphate N-acetyltransferase